MRSKLSYRVATKKKCSLFNSLDMIMGAGLAVSKKGSGERSEGQVTRK